MSNCFHGSLHIGCNFSFRQTSRYDDVEDDDNCHDEEESKVSMNGMFVLILMGKEVRQELCN